jgi:hypothetical protein
MFAPVWGATPLAAPFVLGASGFSHNNVNKLPYVQRRGLHIERLENDLRLGREAGIPPRKTRAPPLARCLRFITRFKRLNSPQNTIKRFGKC